MADMEVVDEVWFIRPLVQIMHLHADNDIVM